MSSVITFSIIIPFKTWSVDLDENIVHLREQTLRGFEIILLPDGETTLPEIYLDLPIFIYPTGEVNPALKRDLGVEKSKGKYLAFIDDDAYPQSDWLEVALNALESRNDISAVGGPAVIPANDPFWAKVFGAIFLSNFSGGFKKRYVPSPPTHMIDDWPTVNLIVNKKAFDQIGGFNTAFWPGEDTKLCLDLVLHGFNIFYIPELIVFHHRRSQLLKHMRQVGNYGYHRAIFSRQFPKTSRRFIFFIPAIFTIFLIGGFGLTLLHPEVKMIYESGLLVYGLNLLMALKDIAEKEGLLVAVLSAPFIFFSHLWYGIRFIQGLGNREYKASLGR
jgi:glycosyltransferase involved in cell wall biosynthesis